MAAGNERGAAVRLACAAAFILLTAGLVVTAAAPAPLPATAQPLRAPAAQASASNSLREWWFAPKGAHRRPGIPAAAARLARTYSALWIGPRRDKVVYLSFDEAYEMGTTARIVGILDRAHVKATFFVTGQYVRANPALMRRQAAHGEVVGNHTGTHADMVLKARDRSAFTAELRATERAYQAATGRPLARLFRPPFGRYSARVLQLAGQLGYTTVFWSFAHGDYDDDAQPPASVTLKRILDAGYPGALYLLHASSRSNVDALARAIGGLKARGFRFGTLAELAAL
jgi:peptidoglycan-N-acetylmuramic acid deacetylase